jgi:hypothetical protein
LAWPPSSLVLVLDGLAVRCVERSESLFELVVSR